jgi:hypothetical protein
LLSLIETGRALHNKIVYIIIDKTIDYIICESSSGATRKKAKYYKLLLTLFADQEKIRNMITFDRVTLMINKIYELPELKHVEDLLYVPKGLVRLYKHKALALILGKGIHVHVLEQTKSYLTNAIS